MPSRAHMRQARAAPTTPPGGAGGGSSFVGADAVDDQRTGVESDRVGGREAVEGIVEAVTALFVALEQSRELPDLGFVPARVRRRLCERRGRDACDAQL